MRNSETSQESSSDSPCVVNGAGVSQGNNGESWRDYLRSFWKELLKIGARLIAAGVILALALLAFCVFLKLLDRLEIIRKSLEIFEPYSSSMPCVLVILTLVLLLIVCYPDVAKWLASIERITLAGHCVSRTVPFVLNEKTASRLLELMKMAVEEQLNHTQITGRNGADCMLAFVTNSRDKFKTDTDENREETDSERQIHEMVSKWAGSDDRELMILQHHERDVGAQLVNRDVVFGDGRMIFDGLYRKGRQWILAEVRRWKEYAASEERIQRIVDEYRGQLARMPSQKAKQFSLHLLFDCDGRQRPKPETIMSMMKRFDCEDSFKVFFFETKVPWARNRKSEPSEASVNPESKE